MSQLADAGAFRADPYILAAMELQSLGREKALVRLHAMAQRKELDAPVWYLCRMLFAARPGSQFKGRGIGNHLYPDNTMDADWPLEPIELVDGVPFLLPVALFFTGEWPPVDLYVKYCEASCDWSSYRFSLKSERQKRDALSKLLMSPRWKIALPEAALKEFEMQIS